LDQRVQEQVLRNALDLIHKDGLEATVIWVLSNTSLTDMFDRIVVFDKGKLVEDGTHETLLQKSGIFKELVS
jgi:putative ABC transport system ATP-binding protein